MAIVDLVFSDTESQSTDERRNIDPVEMPGHTNMQWCEGHRGDKMEPRYLVCGQSWNLLEPMEKNRDLELLQLSICVRCVNEWLKGGSSISLLCYVLSPVPLRSPAPQDAYDWPLKRPHNVI